MSKTGAGRFIHTFRFQITAWYLGFFTLLFVLFSLFLYGVLGRSLAARLDETLLSQINTVEVLFRDEVEELHGDVPRAAHEVVSDMRVHNTIAIFSESAMVASNGAAPDLPGLRGIKEAERILVLPHARAAVGRITAGGATYYIVAMEPLDFIDASLQVVRRVIFLGLPVLLALAGIGGFLVASRSLAPLQWMAEQARRISGSNLHTRLAIGDAAQELAVLSDSFNELLARLDQSFDAMRRFVADASHELRTPLSVIRGEADVALSHDRNSAEYRESLAIILDESRRLSRLVDDLLNLARADSGRVQLRIHEFYFNELLTDCCRSVQALAAARDVSVECRTAGDIPFSGDEELLRRLVINLLDNAIRYTPAGGKVSAAVDSEAQGVRLRISDTGVGIPPEAVPHVFERFFRADKARSRADGGFGLGLSIVKWIAESHNGAVELDSRPSAGSTFTVTLPR
jgi:two-component system OmpR family sensor kinase